MKNIIVVFAFVIGTLSHAQDCDWHLTKDIEKGYRVEFPNEPRSESQDIPTALGTLVMDYYMLDLSSEVSTNNLVYMTAVTDYPEDDYSSEDLQNSMLDGSVNGAVGNVNGELVSSEKIKFNGFNGRYAKITISNGLYTIHLKNILVDNTLYFLQVICDSSKDDNEDIKKFFNSFELILKR